MIWPRARLTGALALSGACAVNAPVLNRLAPGCYETQPVGWSTAMTELVGFTIPRQVYLDSAFTSNNWNQRRQGHPTGWELQTTWTSTSGDWLRLPGDTVIAIRGATFFHDLGGDSIIVYWRGRKGSVTAYLEPTRGGFRGLAQLGPRPFARDLPTPRVELRRVVCRS